MRLFLWKDLVQWCLPLVHVCHHGERKRLLREKNEKESLEVMVLGRYSYIINGWHYNICMDLSFFSCAGALQGELPRD